MQNFKIFFFFNETIRKYDVNRQSFYWLEREIILKLLYSNFSLPMAVELISNVNKLVHFKNVTQCFWEE